MSDTFSFTNSRGDQYYLHGKVITLRNSREQQIYWFARAVDLATHLPEVPAGYEVMETKRTGMPVLRKV